MEKEEIKQLRLSLSMTQEDFAYKVGVSLRTIGRWENGSSVPSNLAVAKLKKLSKKIVVNI